MRLVPEEKTNWIANSSLLTPNSQLLTPNSQLLTSNS